MTFDPRSDATVGYHLFFEPRGAAALELSLLIRNLAAAYGGPVFPPHVTLLAGIPAGDEAALAEQTARLAHGMRPFTLSFDGFGIEDAYFRALYLTVRERDEMDALHREASARFSLEPSPAYRAHLSLLYGTYPREAKEQTRDALTLPTAQAVTVSSVHLYRTEGGAAAWKRVREFPFGG